MDLPRAFARQFIRRQPPSLRVVVLVHLVRFAHWDPRRRTWGSAFASV